MAKQAKLAGVQDADDKALDDMVDEYKEKQVARMELLKQEIELKGKVLDAMRDRDLTEYVTTGGEYKVEIKEGKDKLKVSPLDSEEE